MLETKVMINWIFITSCGNSASQSRTKSLSFPRQFLPLDFVAWIKNKLKKEKNQQHLCGKLWLRNLTWQSPPTNFWPTVGAGESRTNIFRHMSHWSTNLGFKNGLYVKNAWCQYSTKHSTKRSLHVSVQFSYTGSWDPASKVKPVNVLSHNELHLKMKMTDEICLLYINWWWVFCDVNLFRCAYATIKNCKLIFEA